MALGSFLLCAAGVAQAAQEAPAWQNLAYPIIATNSIDGSVRSYGRNEQGGATPVVVSTRRNDDGSYTRTVTDADGRVTTSTISR